MIKVLVVTDRTETADLERWARAAGCQPVLLPADQDILKSAEQASANAVMLFLTNYAKANSLARIIKQENQVPVLLLMAPAAWRQVVLPLEADDFVAFPGSPEELNLRLRRLTPGDGAGSEEIRCGEMIIDLASCEVRLGGEPLDLTFREFELLKFLASNRGRAFTREVLLNRVWGYDYFGGDRTVDVHIRRLRSKTDLLDRPYIETVRNIGYRFRKND
jgi:DNA-binding response OmpR family regulator